MVGHCRTLQGSCSLLAGVLPPAYWKERLWSARREHAHGCFTLANRMIRIARETHRTRARLRRETSPAYHRGFLLAAFVAAPIRQAQVTDRRRLTLGTCGTVHNHTQPHTPVPSTLAKQHQSHRLIRHGMATHLDQRPLAMLFDDPLNLRADLGKCLMLYDAADLHA